jgi:hypothetical protein
MERSDLQALARTTATLLAVLCAAFALSQLVYFGIAWFLLRGPGALEPLAAALPGVLSWVLAAVGLGMVMAAPALQSSLLRQARESAGSVEEYLGRHRAAAVIGYALRESAGVIGLVVSLLGGDLRWVLGLGLLAAVTLLGAWPRTLAIEEGGRAVAQRVEIEQGARSEAIQTGSVETLSEPRRR